MMNKRQSKITNVEIVSAEKLWPGNERCKGKFVARGNIMQGDERFPEECPIRTSLLVKIDIEQGYIETLNTIYHIV